MTPAELSAWQNQYATLTVGKHSISAGYGGDADDAASASAAMEQVVVK